MRLLLLLLLFAAFVHAGYVYIISNNTKATTSEDAAYILYYKSDSYICLRFVAVNTDGTFSAVADFPPVDIFLRNGSVVRVSFPNAVSKYCFSTSSYIVYYRLYASYVREYRVVAPLALALGANAIPRLFAAASDSDFTTNQVYVITTPNDYVYWSGNVTFGFVYDTPAYKVWIDGGVFPSVSYTQYSIATVKIPTPLLQRPALALFYSAQKTLTTTIQLNTYMYFTLTSQTAATQTISIRIPQEKYNVSLTPLFRISNQSAPPEVALLYVAMSAGVAYFLYTRREPTRNAIAFSAVFDAAMFTVFVALASMHYFAYLAGVAAAMLAAKLAFAIFTREG